MLTQNILIAMESSRSPVTPMRPLNGKVQIVNDICSAKQAMELLSARDDSNYTNETAGTQEFTDADYWHWSDCRRIYSEPATGLQDSSRGSVTSCGSGEESCIEDDVFSDCSDDDEYCEDEGTS